MIEKTLYEILGSHLIWNSLRLAKRRGGSKLSACGYKSSILCLLLTGFGRNPKSESKHGQSLIVTKGDEIQGRLSSHRKRTGIYNSFIGWNGPMHADTREMDVAAALSRNIWNVPRDRTAIEIWIDFHLVNIKRPIHQSIRNNLIPENSILPIEKNGVSERKYFFKALVCEFSSLDVIRAETNRGNGFWKICYNFMFLGFLDCCRLSLFYLRTNESRSEN